MLLEVTIMMFDPDTNKWTKYCRDCCASCAIGNGSNDNGFHSSVDVCHTAIQKWSSLPPMTTQRDECAPLVTRFIFLEGHNGQYIFYHQLKFMTSLLRKGFIAQLLLLVEIMGHVIHHVKYLILLQRPGHLLCLTLYVKVSGKPWNETTLKAFRQYTKLDQLEM